MTNQKQHIREKISTYKKALSGQTIIDLSRKICDRLTQTERFKKANCIALYHAMSDEVQTSELIEEWFDKKIIALPVVSGEDINFHAYTGKKNLTKNIFGILEPSSDKPIPPEEIDIFIIPGVAFDHNYNRLGRGKGYYDRYLTGTNKPMIGICFDFQLLEHIPTEKHDIKMDIIITESVTMFK